MLLLSRFVRLSVLLLAVTLPAAARGEGWSFDGAHQDWGGFALGFATAVAAHEAGHYFVATSLGYKVSRDGVYVVYPGAQFTHADQLKVASAGFQTQWLLTELVFRDRNGKEIKAPPDNFGAGIVCAHLGMTLVYLTVAKNNKRGDVVGMSEATGRSNNQLALALAVPGVLDAWRLFGKDVPDWVPQVSMTAKGLAIARIWTY